MAPERPLREGSGEPAWTDAQLVSPHTVADKSDRVRSMFNGIAARYELVNSVFSGGRDARWRRRAVALAGVTPSDEVLDVACGTGSFARAFASAGARLVVGVDFARDMLGQALRQSDDGRNGSAGPTAWCEADALRLPFGSGAFTLASCAFGVRNFSNPADGLAEMYRVLVPGGRVVILEFTRPPNRLVRFAYELYSTRIMPWGATLLSGDTSGAYRYLPRSVVSFMGASEFCDQLSRAGFCDVGATSMNLGIVSVYLGTKPGG